jgi:hypothetical protein
VVIKVLNTSGLINNYLRSLIQYSTFGTLCNVGMFLWHNLRICRNTSIRWCWCFFWFINGLPVLNICSVRDHNIVAWINARYSKRDYDLRSNSRQVTRKNGNLPGCACIIDVHANKKSQHFSNEDQIRNNLSNDRSPTECVHSFIWLYHEVWIF